MALDHYSRFELAQGDCGGDSFDLNPVFPLMCVARVKEALIKLRFVA